MIMPKSYRPLFVTALLLCSAVAAIDVVRWAVQGRSVDATTMTTALLFCVGMVWCLRRSVEQAGAHG